MNPKDYFDVLSVGSISSFDETRDPEAVFAITKVALAKTSSQSGRVSLTRLSLL